MMRGLSLLVCGVVAGWTVPASHSVSLRPGHVGLAASRASPKAMLATQISRDAPAPTGPDPYKLVYEELEFIKASLKKVLTSKGKGSTGALTSNEVLTMAAREFMQRKGKSFRPMLVLLIGRATDPDFVTDARHSKLAVIAEMMHTASLIHADVLEEHVTDTTQGTLVHQEVALDVGNKVCILAGDFLLAKAAVELSLLESSKVTEIVASGLESICEGGMMGFNSTSKSAEMEALTLELHLDIVSHTTAQLVANACQSSAILSGHDSASKVARACQAYGEKLTMARQLITEAQAMEALLRSCRRNPKKFSALQPRSTPFLLAAQQYPELRVLLASPNSPALKAETAIGLLERSGAVEATQDRAEAYAQQAADSLNLLPSSDARDALQLLCHKVISRTPLK